MAFHRPRILCVDDDLEVCLLLAAWMPDARIDNAQTVAEGLRTAFDGSFDLYVLDTWLPDGDGVELCRRIREFDPNAPVIFFSAVAYDAARQKALAAGATAYLTKPLEFDEVCRLIPHLIKTNGHSIGAIREELRAVYEELALQLREAEKRFDAASARYESARREVAMSQVRREKLKSAACRGYIEGGGTRAQFERLWPGVLLTPKSVSRFLDQQKGTSFA